MKKCPYCAEEIQDNAIVCRFCGRDLTSGALPIQGETVQGPTIKVDAAKKTTSKRKRLLLIVGGILVSLCLCIAILPLLSPDNDNTVDKGLSSTLVSGENLEAEESVALAENTQETDPTEPISTSTNTVVPTKTATETPIPTATATKTAIPAEFQTQTAVSSIATEQAADVTATAIVVAREKTRTQEAIIGTATEMASYIQIPWKELITYPDNHAGEKIYVRGRIFNVIDNTDFQIYIAGTYEAVYITMLDAYSDLYENDVVTIYGVVVGEVCGTNAYGGEICQPQVAGVYYQK